MPVRVDRTDEIQKTLANVYLDLYKEIKKNPNYPSYVPALQLQYQRKVYDATRQAITQVFAQGHNYVGRVLKVETFMSLTDLAQIKSETDSAVSKFWTRVQADAQRETEIEAASNRLIVTEQKQEFDTPFYLQNAAMIATTGALAISTLSKTEQITTDPQLKDEVKTPKIRWVARQDEKTCLQLPNGGEGCAFLDNQMWEIDDPEIPVPGRLGPNGTHPNCRCYLSLE